MLILRDIHRIIEWFGLEGTLKIIGSNPLTAHAHKVAGGAVCLVLNWVGGCNLSLPSLPFS